MGNCLNRKGERARDAERNPLLGTPPDSGGTNTPVKDDSAFVTNSRTSSTPPSSPDAPSESSPTSPTLGFDTGQLAASSSSLLPPESVSGRVAATRSTKQLDSISQAIQQLTLGSQAALGTFQNEVQGVRGDVVAARGEVAVLSQQTVDAAEQIRHRSNIERLPIVPGASYDALLGCMKNTRTSIIQEIVGFLTQEDVGDTRVLLLYGCAGSGKTAIAHTVARICEQEHRSLGGSFFFQAGQYLRDTPQQLISTLARNLSSRNSAFASKLSEAIESNPSITQAPLANQFQSLLLNPILEITSQSQPLALVIDAIDEGWSEQLLPILKSCSELPPWIRIFVTLRDDGSILPRLRHQTHIRRREIDISTTSNIHDVRLYIVERLRTIANDRELDSWPTDEEIDIICAKADGLFVWAAVACNSIADVDLDPLEQFNELIGGGLLRDTRASSQMDDLYLKVLSKCHLDEPRALSRYRECVGTLLALKRPLSIPAIDNILGTKHSQFTYRPLSSVIRGLANQPHPIRIVHHSFREFITQELSDTSPFQKYMIVPNAHNDSLALRCLILIGDEMPTIADHTRWIIDEERNTKSSIPTLSDDIISEPLWYACIYVMEHINTVIYPAQELSESFARFQRNDLYGWLAVCVMKGKCHGIENLLKLLQRFKRDGNVDTDLTLLAKVMLVLSRGLKHDNRLEEAVLTARAAVSSCREFGMLTTKSKNLIGRALVILSNRLSDLGHSEEALSVVRQCVEVYRALASEQPNAFNPNLGKCLISLSVHLSHLGYYEEALRVICECVNLYRVLAGNRPATFRPNLAMSLNNLSNRLSDLGRRQEALAAVIECVAIYRALTSDQPAIFQIHLARSLNNLSVHLSALGYREEALAAARECVDLYRVLAKSRPATFKPKLSGSLNNLSNHLLDLGHRDEALAAITECVTLFRDLARGRPTAFNPDLAGSLHNLSNCLSELGRHKEALVLEGECVDLYRALGRDKPVAFNPGLAMSLLSLARKHDRDTDNLSIAISACQEAESLYRKLAEHLPLVHHLEWRRSCDLLDSLTKAAMQTYSEVLA